MNEYTENKEEHFINRYNSKKRYLCERIERLSKIEEWTETIRECIEEESEKLDYIRPGNDEDMQYRIEQINKFPNQIEELNLRLGYTFYGLPIYTGVDFLCDKQINTEQNGTINEAIDKAIDLRECSMPAGCICVFEEENKKDKGNNLFLKDLVGIITTPENMENMMETMKNSNLSVKKLFDYDSFYDFMKTKSKKAEKRYQLANKLKKHKFLKKIPLLKRFINDQDKITKNINKKVAQREKSSFRKDIKVNSQNISQPQLTKKSTKKVEKTH